MRSCACLKMRTEILNIFDHFDGSRVDPESTNFNAHEKLKPFEDCCVNENQCYYICMIAQGQ